MENLSNRPKMSYRHLAIWILFFIERKGVTWVSDVLNRFGGDLRTEEGNWSYVDMMRKELTPEQANKIHLCECDLPIQKDEYGRLYCVNHICDVHSLVGARESYQKEGK